MLTSGGIASNTTLGGGLTLTAYDSSLPDMITCVDDDVAAHVPSPLRQKIWANQYINLALLLKGSTELQEFYAGSNLYINEHGVLESKPKVLRDRIPTIERWSDAFLIFMHVYLRKYPEKTLELIQYMTIIRDAASRCQGAGWRIYDEQFRLRQAICPQSWARLNSDLWLRLLAVPRSNTGGPGYSVGSQSQGPGAYKQGVCNAYNENKCKFNPCRFKHVCKHCNGGHPQMSCNSFRGNSFRKQNTSQQVGNQGNNKSGKVQSGVNSGKN